MYQKKYRYRKEIGIEKMYQIRYRKKLVSEKVSDSVSFRFSSHTAQEAAKNKQKIINTWVVKS